MSRHNSSTAFAGFSVFQPALGSTLQWLPALGSLELDDMIHTLLPGPASIQDKRAHISMDFYEYSRHTGESFRFYPVYPASRAPTATDSPASSSALQDSGYGSSFNVSPVVSDMVPWTPSAPASTPASNTSDSRTKSRSGPSQNRTSTTSRQPLDFSNHPGMRILTKDGRDVTNSASRGCKSKEQRDHAHLMRIIKACDACRRKKIRCDPSHKKRTATQAQPSRQDLKQTIKANFTVHESPSQDASFATPSSQDSVPSFEPDMIAGNSFDSHCETPDDFWQQFVHFDDQAVPSLEGYDFSLHPAGYLTSNMGSMSASPSQSLLPATPSLQDNYGLFLPDLASQQPILPYLNPGESYGTNYQDFNLYSPGSDVLDEEPQSVKKHRHKEQIDIGAVDSNLKQSSQDVTDVDVNLSTGLGRDQGDVPGTDFSDWCHIDIDRNHAETTNARARHAPEDIITAIDAHTNRLATVDLPTLPRLSLSHGTYQGASLNRASPGGLEPVHSAQAGIPILASASACADVQTYSGHVANTSGDQLTVPLAAVAQSETPLAALAVAGGLTLDVASPALTSAVQSAGSGLLRPSRFVIDPFVSATDHTSGVVSRDLAVCSVLSAATWRDTDVHWNVRGTAEGHDAAVRPPSAPQARRVLSRSGSSSLAGPGLDASLVACSLLAPDPTPQGVPGVRPGSQQLRTLQYPTSSDLVSLCLVSCLLVILLSWAGVQWQWDFVLAVCLPIYSHHGASDNGHLRSRSKSVAARSASLLRRGLGRIAWGCA